MVENDVDDDVDDDIDDVGRQNYIGNNIYRVDQKKVALVQKKVANFILHLETSGFFYWLNLVLWILNL